MLKKNNPLWLLFLFFTFQACQKQPKPPSDESNSVLKNKPFTGISIHNTDTMHITEDKPPSIDPPLKNDTKDEQKSTETTPPPAMPTEEPLSEGPIQDSHNTVPVTEKNPSALPQPSAHKKIVDINSFTSHTWLVHEKYPDQQYRSIQRLIGFCASHQLYMLSIHYSDIKGDDPQEIRFQSGTWEENTIQPALKQNQMQYLSGYLNFTFTTQNPSEAKQRNMLLFLEEQPSHSEENTPERLEITFFENNPNITAQTSTPHTLSVSEQYIPFSEENRIYTRCDYFSPEQLPQKYKEYKELLKQQKD